MYLLDTNVISEVRKIKTGKANPRFVEWFSTIAEKDIFINAMVLMEIERGILAKERKDFIQGVRFYAVGLIMSYCRLFTAKF